MTQRYAVTGVKVKFGPGFVLELDKDQSGSRSHLLEKLKSGHYRVLTQVEFKRGEELGIVSGDVPKAWSGFLAPADSRAETSGDHIRLPVKAIHRGFGKWDVVDPEEIAVNDESLTKEDALALAKKLNAGT